MSWESEYFEKGYKNRTAHRSFFVGKSANEGYDSEKSRKY